MRSLKHRIINNIKQPITLAAWYAYQKSRTPDQDTILVTMPNSGTYWLRVMLAQALIRAYDLPNDISGITVPHLIPTYRRKLDRFAYNDRTDIPRIQQSHSEYSAFWFKGRRVILLVRDLRDTLLSHFRIMSSTGIYSRSFSDFLRGHDINTENHITLVGRVRFLNKWSTARRKVREMLLVRYEDLKNDTQGELRRILKYIGFPELPDEIIDQVVDFGTIDNMRKLERKNPIVLYKGITSKVNKGAVGNFTDGFNNEDLIFFQEYIKNNLLYSYEYDYFA